MRVFRILVLVALAASLLTGPALTVGQSSSPGADASQPLARRPDGRLPLESTPWRLRSYRWQDGQRRPGPEVAARLRLEAGQLEASGGCTPFKGTYGTSGPAIDLRLKGLRQNDCGEQTTMVQLAMVDGLRDAARYEIDEADDESQLALFDDGGTELLRFGLDDVSTFAGTQARAEWRLSAFTVDGQQREPDPEATPNLVFLPEQGSEARRRSSGEVLGSTGCNGFRGTFSLHANVMSFGDLSVTDAPCGQSTTAQQDAILEVFEATAVMVRFPADRMILASSDSRTALEYLAVPALEGSTWERAARAGSEPGDPVTLRLESGTASGEGPCGAYVADYVTDGLFITFSDVRGADDGPCEAVEEERRLFKALRSTVSLGRDQKRPGRPRLTLRDARGEALVRFEYPFGSAP
jgi:heat shock protein HslJ